MYTDASNQIANETGINLNLYDCKPLNLSVIVRKNGVFPVTSSFSSIIPSSSQLLYLYDINIAPDVIKNPFVFLDNSHVLMIFNPFDFALKDAHMKKILIICNSLEPLHPL